MWLLTLMRKRRRSNPGPLMSQRARIAEALRAGRNILLVNHVDADGDSLGSTLALAMALEALPSPRGSRRVTVASDTGVPHTFAFLPGAGNVITDLPPDAAFDVALTMECSTLDRCGRFASVVAQTPLIIMLDHHESAVPFGHLNDIDPSVAAMGEVVTEIITHLNVPMTPDIATNLLAAVMTDTGVFRFPTVRPRTLRLGADLLERGGRLVEVVTKVYESRTVPATRLLGLTLSRIVLAADGRIVYSVITQDMRNQVEASLEDAGGIIGALRAVEGAQIAMLFEESQGRIRVSIRSRDGPRSHVIAERFGGGGHPEAAGCIVDGPADHAVSRLLEAARLELAHSG